MSLVPHALHLAGEILRVPLTYSGRRAWLPYGGIAMTRYADAEFAIEPSQGDGWKITTPHGWIDYRHNPDMGVNEIWWVESHRKGHGSELVDLMQRHHLAGTIAWGVTTHAGKGLRDKWHAAHPEVAQSNGAFEGQFDPSGDNYGEDVLDDEFDEDFDDDFDDDY